MGELTVRAAAMVAALFPPRPAGQQHGPIQRLPPGAAQPMSDELRARTAEMNARIAEAEERGRAFAAREKEYNAGNNRMYRPNIASLDAAGTQREIDDVSSLLQSGRFADYSLRGGYGDRRTSDMNQYLLWLQEHQQAISTPAAQPGS